MRGTLSRFADFDSPAACLPLAIWCSLRAIPLSFLSASKLPEVRMPTLSSARPHLLVLVAEQGERFYFGLNTAAFDSLRRQSQYNIATQERLGRPQALQAVNQGGESLTLSGVVFAQMAGMTQLNALRRIGFQMKPVELIAGHGETLGRWYLASVSEDQSDLMADGAPRKQTFTVEFKRYGDDYQNL